MEWILYSSSGVIVRLRAGMQLAVTGSPVLTVRLNCITTAPRPPAAAGDGAYFHFTPPFSSILHEASWVRRAQHMIHRVAGDLVHPQDLRFLVRTFCNYSHGALQSFLMRGGGGGGFLSLSVCVQIPDASTAAFGPNNPLQRPHLPDPVLVLWPEEEEDDDEDWDDGDATVDVGNKPASASAVQRLKIIVFGEVNGGCRETSCAVCMDGFEATSVLSVMPCRHGFHSACLEEWLKRSHLCPLCRFSLPAAN